MSKIHRLRTKNMTLRFFSELLDFSTYDPTPGIALMGLKAKTVRNGALWSNIWSQEEKFEVCM